MEWDDIIRYDDENLPELEPEDYVLRHEAEDAIREREDRITHLKQAGAAGRPFGETPLGGNRTRSGGRFRAARRLRVGAVRSRALRAGRSRIRVSGDLRGWIGLGEVLALDAKAVGAAGFRRGRVSSRSSRIKVEKSKYYCFQ